LEYINPVYIEHDNTVLVTYSFLASALSLCSCDMQASPAQYATIDDQPIGLAARIRPSLSLNITCKQFGWMSNR